MEFDDIENIGRWLYGLACAQRVTGGTEGAESIQRLLDEADRRIEDPYGFVYSTEYSSERGIQQRYAWLWGERAVLEGWIQCWRSAQSESDRQALQMRIDRLLEGLQAFAVRKGKCAFFPTYTPKLGYEPAKDLELPRGPDHSEWKQLYSETEANDDRYLPLPADSLGGVIWPLVEWFELTGNEKALDLAVAVSHTVVEYHSLRSNDVLPFGCFANIHGVLNAMAGILACHRHVPNSRHFIWVGTLFEYFLNRCSSTFGWVLEFEQDRSGLVTQRHTAEGCAVVDMVRVAIELARCGMEYGWDVAERFTRNYMTQAQIREISEFAVAPDTVVNHGGRSAVNAVPEDQRDDQDIWKRVVGAMAGWGAPNDVLDPRGRLAMCIQNCCSSHLPMGLMHVWEQIVTKEGDTVFINMLLSQDGPFCETVDSQPDLGQLQITLKEKAKVAVRIPDWVDDSLLSVSVDGAECAFELGPHSRFMRLPAIPEGATIRLNYPLREEVKTERLAGTLYTTTWRGDTVVEISPKGSYVPIFA